MPKIVKNEFDNAGGNSVNHSNRELKLSQNDYMEKSAIYPGSFDPITNGHIDIIRRGAKLFPSIVVAVLRESRRRDPVFTTEERIEIIREIFKDEPADRSQGSFHGLLVDFARDNRASGSSSAACGPFRTSNTNSRWP